MTDSLFQSDASYGEENFPPQRFFKRYRMECSITSARFDSWELPEGFQWAPWQQGISRSHALALYQSFVHEKDSQLFLSFSTMTGCENLLLDMSQREDFLPEATWLIDSPNGPCATLQSLELNGGIVSVQNIAVVPAHRGKGLGKALVQKLFQVMRAEKLTAATLEVTADNHRAIQLYQSMGFTKTRVLYKEIPNPVQAPIQRP